MTTIVFPEFFRVDFNLQQFTNNCGIGVITDIQFSSCTPSVDRYRQTYFQALDEEHKKIASVLLKYFLLNKPFPKAYSKYKYPVFNQYRRHPMMYEYSSVDRPRAKHAIYLLSGAVNNDGTPKGYTDTTRFCKYARLRKGPPTVSPVHPEHKVNFWYFTKEDMNCDKVIVVGE